MKKLLNANWGIYEYDIIDLGGSVEYTGNIIKKRRNSFYEDALITYGDVQCEARFERFKHGNADLHCFLCNGIPENDNDTNRENPNSRLFMKKFMSVCENDDVFLELQFTRRVKQYGTLALQFICAIMLLLSIRLLFHPVTFIRGLILIGGNILLICLLSTFYKYYRMMRISEYKPWFFAKDERDD